MAAIKLTSVTAYLTLVLSISLVKGQCFKSDLVSEQPASEKATAEYQAVFYEQQLEFSLDMFHKLYNKENRTNLFFSPYSIHQALIMTYFGAGGETRKQLQTALHIKETDTKDELIRAFKMENFYQETRSENTTQYDLKVANRIFFSDEEPVRPCVQEIFSKEIELLNIVNETEKSREHINSWVEENTRGKIKDLIGSGHMDKETRIAIANAAYFKGSWEQQFKKSHTKLALFYVSQKEVTPTMMMYQKGSFRHGVSEELKAYIIELPYEGEAISMFILLPPFTPNALQDTISRLNASTLREAMDGMYPDSIEIFLPRFKIEQTFDLSQALRAVGVVDLFDEVAANLTDFSEKPGLAIGSARHKSYLEVSEQGSTAAAATALIGTRSGRPLDQTRFVCNHPFVFFIYDNALKNILFMGAFHTPKSAEKS
ncbi:Serpin B9 [Orchesella cincta]|uniref:Serpin B9 n=1 Tax=Orchesella cincta TaxID=48709 RepID=A0A1D2NA33_ORCCI|nr:Serpin B9 [Orchesella cincta]